MPSVSTPPALPAPIVVLVSGTGSLLQALLEATADPAYGVRIAAVGADREDIEGLGRARGAGLPTFVERVGDHPDRATWNHALAAQVAAHAPRFVVTAGFMRLLGPQVLARWSVLNTHPALLPSFPGVHGVRDALEYGVRLSGTTAHLVDAGMDTGPIIDQRSVPVYPEDTEEQLHERIKVVERALLVDLVGRMARYGWQVQGRRVQVPTGEEPAPTPASETR